MTKRFFRGGVMLLSRFIAGMLPVGPILLAAGVVSGQDYPNKPVRIVTATPGGGGDFAARLIAQAISGPLGQPVIVDNRTTILAAEAVAKASPDGYTLVVQGNTIWITPLLLKTSYDMVRDFSAISLLLRETSILAVHPSLPAKSVKQLIALAKARPGELNYAASNIGAASHLAAELFKSMAGVNIVHIPFKGTSSAIAAVIGGEVQLTISTIAAVIPQVKPGKLRALAVTSAQPSVLAPGLPRAMIAAGVLAGAKEHNS
jgi:tripartite-type tricarboxylate transporter receptor subunit TctC